MSENSNETVAPTEVVLPTWGGKSTFRYSGNVETGTTIIYGRGRNGQGHKKIVSANDYVRICRNFENRVAAVNPSRLVAESLGGWMRDVEISKTRIAPYVAAILEHERFAERVQVRRIHIIKQP